MEVQVFPPNIGLTRNEISIYAAWVKRPLDVVLAITVGAVCLPVLVIVSLLVNADGGPILFKQARVGRGNRTFRIWKFRSMVVDAEARLQKHLASDPEARDEWNAHQKLKRDPRVTAIGRLIRRTSIDEIPQLWNILKGDMSFVGPRPIMLSQKDIYPDASELPVRPGLTGLWQVSARHESTFVERLACDERYLRNLCFAMDVGIIMRTVPAVLRGTGV